MALKPPYQLIAKLLKQGRVVPFLGAGVNFGMRQPQDSEWHEKDSAFLPSGSELSQYLADLISFPSDDRHDRCDLAKVASYFVEASTRPILREQLQSVFAREYMPSAIHNYLAQIALHYVDSKPQGTPLLIVTTNYDDLTEKAFKSLGRPYDLVIYPTDSNDVAASVLWWKDGATDPVAVLPNKLFIDLEKSNVIYKMHGSVDRERHKLSSFVVTEEDYVDFLSRMTTHGAVPAQFMRYFHSRHFLFLGYGLGDWNLRVVLKNLRMILPSVEIDPLTGSPPSSSETKDDESLTSWAIQYLPSDLEMALWDARRVKIFNQDINEFARGLEGGERNK
jgi:hypothetical protein